MHRLVAEVDVSVEESLPVDPQFVEALADQRPLVVVFDDIHWGEPTFLDLVEYLADWTRDVPVLLLCLARPELLDVRPDWGGGKLNATSVLLEPLSDDECTRAGRRTSSARPSLRPTSEPASPTPPKGIPLFVEEMLSMLIDDGFSSATRVAGRRPATCDGSCAADDPRACSPLASIGLTGDERTVIERAAVEGKVVPRPASVEALPAGLGSPVAVAPELASCARS